MRDTSGFVTDDDLAVAPLAELGRTVHWQPWQDARVDWNRFDLVVIRSPWDYQQQPALFLGVLAQIDRSRARLHNSLELVRWNLDKHYLRDLEQRGIPIVPTRWGTHLDAVQWTRLWNGLDCDEMVLKPVIGANADGVLRLTQGQSELAIAAYGTAPFMAQPFVSAITIEGEYSLFYFNGEFSHAICKTPASGDFRVQEEHGAALAGVAPEPSLRMAADGLVDRIAPLPLYLRADFVRSPDPHRWWLMELELIEPSLYLRMDPAAASRFARAIDSRFGY